MKGPGLDNIYIDIDCKPILRSLFLYIFGVTILILDKKYLQSGHIKCLRFLRIIKSLILLILWT
jgi:hypothetical protein